MNKLKYLYYLKDQQQKKASLQNIKRLEKAIKTIEKGE